MCRHTPTGKREHVESVYSVGSTPTGGTKLVSDDSLTREHILDIRVHVLGRRQRILEPVRARLIDFVKLHYAALAELDRQSLSVFVEQHLSDVR